jgi:hypothetical protein
MKKEPEYVTTRPGTYVDNQNRPIEPHDPTVVICRRVADYNVPAPKDAALDLCATCGAKIFYNPNGPHLDKPRICLQCHGIEPLPIAEGPA